MSRYENNANGNHPVFRIIKLRTQPADDFGRTLDATMVTLNGQITRGPISLLTLINRCDCSGLEMSREVADAILDACEAESNRWPDCPPIASDLYRPPFDLYGPYKTRMAARVWDDLHAGGRRFKREDLNLLAPHYCYGR